ncbi:hypothetical protein VTK73DRAFT_575 [Phialemonium thermophilum]|uniref:Uncharacterized protein n=1 Tax=Phialemonium thermophilum TaxID=223376 RepID=A0ABR3XDM9_9PEZI
MNKAVKTACLLGSSDVQEESHRRMHSRFMGVSGVFKGAQPAGQSWFVSKGTIPISRVECEPTEPSYRDLFPSHSSRLQFSSAYMQASARSDCQRPVSWKDCEVEPGTRRGQALSTGSSPFRGRLKSRQS